MDDSYAIRLAKTKLRDAYNNGSVSGVLSVFADRYSDMSDGLASFTARSTGSAKAADEKALRAI